MLYKINVTEQMEGMECLEKEQRSTEGCEWLAWQVAELQQQASRDNHDEGGHPSRYQDRQAMLVHIRAN